LSTQLRLSSRLRFRDYLRDRRKAPSAEDKAAEKGPKTRHRSLWVLYRALWKLLEGSRSTLAVALSLLTIGTLLKLIPPAATKLTIDYVLLQKPLPDNLPSWLVVPGAPRDRLLVLVGLVLAISLVDALIALRGRWLGTRTTKRVMVAVRRRAFEHAARLPLHRVYQLKSGGASSLLREDAGGVGELVFSMIYNPWRAVVQLIGGLIVLAWVDWRLLAGSLVVAPAIIASDRVWNRLLRPLYRDIRKQRQEIDAKATEAFGGMRIVRAFGRQRTETGRFVRENDMLARQELNAWWWTRLLELSWELLVPVATGMLMLYGGMQVLEGRLSLGDLMMFVVYLAMLLEPIAVLASSVTQVQNNLSGFDRVLDLLEEPREMAEHPGTIAVRKERAAGRITLEGVSFTYPGSDRQVLKGIDLEVEPGETIALVGRSGAGKTTLCNLVARFYDPTEGIVRLDGVDLKDIEVESYRRLLGIVEQDVFLFDGTIAQNIAYASRRASRAEIAEAARVAHAAEFIAELPEGYDTLIGERGVKLSGGQRQRLAIARAVLADPRILVLDEATSNLDTESERLIQQALADVLRDRTAFVIAHRLSTIRDADRILVLDQGAVVEVGTHDELMERGGRYREMVELQQLQAEV
jgi:ATP-binding cassette subfamily B protein/subfamily B ATP-binding cassette protein MsbA